MFFLRESGLENSNDSNRPFKHPIQTGYSFDEMHGRLCYFLFCACDGNCPRTLSARRLQQWLQLFLCSYAKVKYFPVALQVGFKYKIFSQTCCSSLMCL